MVASSNVNSSRSELTDTLLNVNLGALKLTSSLSNINSSAHELMFKLSNVNSFICELMFYISDINSALSETTSAECDKPDDADSEALHAKATEDSSTAHLL